jgi:anti-sigma B factor antagonist
VPDCGTREGVVAAEFGIATRVQADAIRLALSGEFDLGALPDVQAALARVAADHPRRPVLVDLTNATFIDSTVVGALVAARRHAAGRGTTLTVAHARGVVERVLVVAGVYAILRNPTL